MRSDMDFWQCDCLDCGGSPLNDWRSDMGFIRSSLTWMDLVCHGLLKVIPEREVVFLILSFLKPLRRDIEEQEARNLRIMESLNGMSPLCPIVRSSLNSLNMQFREEWHWRAPIERRRSLFNYAQYDDEIDITRLRKLNVGDERDGLWPCWDLKNTGDQEDRIVSSDWYRGINEGRYFLFFRIPPRVAIRGEYYIRMMRSMGQTSYSIDDVLQMIEDLYRIDGVGLGIPATSVVEHIDDMFP
jgi:hypothetical protein